MADDIPGLPYDGTTDVVDLSGNGKGVALNVWPSDNRVPVAEDPIPLDTFVLEMGELAYASTSQRLRVGDGYTPGGDEVAYTADVEQIEQDVLQWMAAVSLALNDKASLTVDNTFTGNQTFNGNVTVNGAFSVADEIYGAAWNGKLDVPTKNAVYDQMETRYAKAGGTLTGNVTISSASPALTFNPVSGTPTLDLRGTASTNDGLSLRASGTTVSFCADTTLFRNRAANTTFGTLNSGSLTMTVPVIVPNEAYAPAWDGKLEAPTKDAVHDKIEAVIASIPPVTSSIVGITGTLAQFDTALTDHNFAVVGRDNNFTANQSIIGANTQLTLNPSSGSSVVELFGAAGTQGFRLQGSAGIGYVRADTVNVTNKTGAVTYGTFAGTGLAVTGNVSVTDEAYGASWNGSLNVPTKNAVYDKFEALGSITVLDDPYGASWDGSLAAPSRNAVYDKIQAMSVGGTGVTTFNTRSGAVVLTSGDVTSALTFTPANKAGDTFTGAVIVPDLVYGLAWSGSFAVPTRNAVYNQIEALTTVVNSKANTSALANYLPLTGGTLSGNLAVNGTAQANYIIATGANAGLVLNDRDGTGDALLYQSADAFRVYIGGADRFTLNANGGSFAGTLSTGGALTTNGVLTVQGASSAISLQDQDGTGDAWIYNNADTFCIFGGGGNRFTVGLGAAGAVTTHGPLFVNAAATASSLIVAPGGTTSAVIDLYKGGEAQSARIVNDGNLHIKSQGAAFPIWFDAAGFNWGPQAGGGGWMQLGLDNAIPKLTVSGSIYSSRTGLVGHRFYNGGSIAEWEIYQPASPAHDFRIATVVAGSYTDRLTITNTGAAAFSGPLDIQGSKAFRHYDGAFGSANIRYSTSAPSGGADGDIWLKYV